MSSSWAALESNPEVFNALMSKLGVPSEWSVHDVYSFDDDMLAMLPQPVKALQMVFHMDAKDGETFTAPTGGEPIEGPFYIEQTAELPNACGTIALIHSVANVDILPSDALLTRFIADVSGLDRTARGNALANNADVRDIHNSLVAHGQSAVIGNDEDVKCHFLSLVPFNGNVVELDGALRTTPINRGAIAPGETFLQAAARIIKRDWMQGDSIQFAVTAIAPAAE
jgi:ubiquitin carboxyl-terminal hydrolase L3